MALVLTPFGFCLVTWSGEVFGQLWCNTEKILVFLTTTFINIVIRSVS